MLPPPEAQMSDSAPKSAYEIAMERLRQQDKEQGVVERPPTEEQKEAIAEARRVHEAKVAELKILHGSRLAAVADWDERERIELEHRRELERLAGDRDRKIARIREGR
jgi:hypothetical protein